MKKDSSTGKNQVDLSRRQVLGLACKGCACLGLARLMIACGADPVKTGDSLLAGCDGYPKINVQACSGCGECVPACPNNAISLLSVGDNGSVSLKLADEQEYVMTVNGSACTLCDNCIPCCSKGAITRGTHTFNTGKCLSCTLDCQVVCQHGAIIQEGGRRKSMDTDKCQNCGECQKLCPRGAIRAPSGAVIDESKCDGCGDCRTACSFGALNLKALNTGDDDNNHPGEPPTIDEGTTPGESDNPTEAADSQAGNTNGKNGPKPGGPRAIAVLDKNKCDQCNDCIAVCSLRAISSR